MLYFCIAVKDTQYVHLSRWGRQSYCEYFAVCIFSFAHSSRQFDDLSELHLSDHINGCAQARLD